LVRGTENAVTTLTLAPFGLRAVRQLRPTSANYSANVYYIKKSYASAIGFGDLIETRTGSGVYGYVGIYTAGDSHSLGVFAGCMPYYDTVLQQYVNKPWYAGTESPSGDIPCLVYDDPTMVFTAQLGGANASNPGNILDRGGNIDLAQNGAPNTTTGMSTAYLDATQYNNTTATLPLRIVGISQLFQPGYDPVGSFYLPTAAGQPTNNYLDVVLNTSEYRTSTGI
jgi:hypothetical protein